MAPLTVEVWADVQCSWFRLFQGVADTARAEGLDYRFDLLKPTNSSLAHQLLHHAERKGARERMSERLYSAYFTQGRHVGRLDELVSLATEAGLEPDEARQVLTDGSLKPATMADQELAHELGVQSVPFYVINDMYGVAGAQSPEALLGIFRQAASETNR